MNADITNFLFGMLFLLGIPYFIMGLIILSRLEKKKMLRKAIIVSPLWPFYESIYDESEKELCRYGKPLFFIIWIGAALLFLLKHL